MRTSNPSTAFLLVIRREFTTRARSRVYLLGTAFVVLAIAGLMLLQTLVFNRQNATPVLKVGFTDQAQALAQPLNGSAPTFGVKVTVRRGVDQAKGVAQVRSGKLDALVSGSPDSPVVLVKDRLNSALRAALDSLAKQQVLDAQLRSAGLDPAAVLGRSASATVRVQSLEPLNVERIQALVIGIVSSGFLYVSLLIYGNFVAQGVVEEKASRVVEILLAAVPPQQLLVGKLIGIGLVGLTQLVIVGAASLILSLLTNVVTIPVIGAGAVAAALLWFVLGYFFYAILFAAGGSLVSRQEDVAAVTMPITILLVAAYVVAISVWTPQLSGAPLSTTGAVLSVLPPFAPLLMPGRMASGDAPIWQVLLAVILLVAWGWVMSWLTARIYANSVLRTGGRVKLSEALRR